MEYRIDRRSEVDSTNEVVKRALEGGEPEGFVCRARVQTGGYGRQGRAWSSPEGGLYQSLLLRPKVPMAQLPTLALVVALAVCEAVLSASGAPDSSVRVKWPNDIMAPVEGAWGKLSGISCEAHAGGVCVGIGVNVMRPHAIQPAAGKNIPVYLADFQEAASERTIGQLGDIILESFSNRYDLWQRKGFSAFADEFARCSLLTGKRVRIADLAGTITAEGTATGIDEEGRLLVQTDIATVAVSSGEAHLQ